MRLNRLRFFMAGLAAVCLLVAVASTAAAQATDTDTDGMPDAWETFFGLNPNSAADATGDPDGDGLTNLQEFTAGRHPVGRFARFFAEGSTGYFETALAVLNLSTTDTAHVSIALLDESGGVTPHQITLAPRSRQSVSLNSVPGIAGAVSIIVESDVAIAADRAMTWGQSGLGLSLDSGAPAPSTTWYFAEGATGPFLLYYLFENPNTAPATITVRYLREGDTPISRTRTLPPHSRTTVFVNADDPGVANASLGAEIISDIPILAERAMYVQANGTFAGGSASSGSPVVSTTFYFGEGATGPFFHAFLSLVNPLGAPATALVTYHLSDGTTASKAYPVPSHGRRTIYFNQEATTDPALAALANGPVWFSINSTGVIAAERAMWWSTWPWYEGHAARGSITSDVAWGVAEGRHGGPANDQTYVLVGNVLTTPGRVRVTMIPDTGAPSTRELDIPAEARLTLDIGSLFGLADASRFSVTVESIGASPVPLAVDYARYRSVNGLPFSGGGAAPAVPLLPGDPAPSVTATTPAAGATGASNTNDIVVTFNEPVNAAAGAFTLACPTGTPIALTVVTASPASQFTLDPGVALPALTACTLTVEASAITDADTDDPPDVMTADAIITFTTALDDNPTVSSTTPAAGATQAGLGANLTITFSEPVDVTGNWFQIVCATSGTRNVVDTLVSGGPTTFTINPNADFVAGESCTVTVVAAQVVDQDPVDPPDAMAANHVFSFTTDVAPTVTGTTPANGATSLGTATNLTVTFSEPVTVTGNWFQVVCATSGTRNLADTVVSGGPTTFVIDPNTSFVAGEACTVTIVAAQITDEDAADPPDAMAANHVFGFTTDVAPTVMATTPADGATNATTTANLTVTFSEPVTVTGNWFGVICSDTGTRSVGDTVVTGGPTTFTIDPNTDFAAGEGCILTLNAAGIVDQDAGDPPDTLAADVFVSFTIDARPAVTVTTPTNGATTASNTDVTVTFSEPVVLTGNWFQIVCAASGARTVADTVVTGGPTTYTINPNVDFAGGETCTVTIVGAQVADQDAADPPDTLAADFVFSFTADAAPSVTSTAPANGATDVMQTTALSVTFSEPVNVTGIWFQIVCTTSGTRLPGNTIVTGGPTTFTITPNVEFAAGETCAVTFAAPQITDQDATDPPDAMAANVVASFTIDAAPTVTATTPTNGATQAATNTNVSLTFSEPVNAAGGSFTISCTVSGAHTFVLSGGPTTWTLNPNTDLTAGETCTVTALAAGISDQDANDPPDTMAANYVFSFTADATPSVTTTTPTNGAVQVGTTANISVTFSEPVDATGSSFTISCTTSGAHTYILGGTPTTYALDPNSDFVSGETCTVTVLAAQVTDQDAVDPPDTMAANFVFSFTIDQAPSVTTTTPTHGATGVSASTNITVNFSENVTAAGGAFTIVCGGASQAFGIAGGSTNVTSITLDPTANLPAGEFCTVTVVAAGITDADAGDPPDTMLADYVFTFAVPPDAVNDARGATGNVSINTATTGFSVLSNDIGPGIAVTAFDATSVQGGTVGVNGAGVFTYTPPVGYEGIDSFTYTITNAAGSDTAAVNVTISGMLWFIDNTASACTTIAAGCGRLGTPFSTLASFNTVNGGGTVGGGDVIDPEAGDHIFIYTGSGNYSAPLTLEASQRVIGQGATSSLAALTGLTFAADSIALPSTGGARPTITSGSTGITLAANDQLHGLAFSNTAGTAINGTVNVGTFAMSEIAITNTAGAGVSLSAGGTVTATGLNTIQTTTGTALNVTNTSIGASGLTFRSIAVNGASRGIVLNGTGVAAGNGGLTVTGIGSTPGSGGTVQNVSVRGGEFINTKALALNNMNFVNANASADGGGAGACDDLIIAGCNAAVYLNGVAGASFSNVHLSGTMVENGITGVDVSNFVFANGSIASAGDEAHESGMEFQNLSGASAITGSTISFSETNSVDIVNFDVNLTLSITNSTLQDTQTVSSGGAANGNGEGGFQFRSFSSAAGSPTTSIDIANSQFLRLRTQAIQAIAEDDSLVDIDITGNTIDSETDIGTGIDLNANDTARIRFNVIGNPTIHSMNGSAVNITTFLDGVGEGRVNGNVIQADGIGSGLRFIAQETSQLTAEARNNTVTLGATSNSNAIDAQARFDTARLDLTLDGNTTTVNATSVADINLTAGSSATGESNIVCANLVDNVASGTGAARALRLRVSDLSNVTRLFLQGFATDGETTWNSNGNTPLSAANSEVTVSLTGTAAAPSGATCLAPANPAP